MSPRLLKQINKSHAFGFKAAQINAFAAHSSDQSLYVTSRVAVARILESGGLWSAVQVKLRPGCNFRCNFLGYLLSKRS